MKRFLSNELYDGMYVQIQGIGMSQIIIKEDGSVYYKKGDLVNKFRVWDYCIETPETIKLNRERVINTILDNQTIDQTHQQ